MLVIHTCQRHVKLGIENGTHLKYALQLCGDTKLTVLPYDFEAYETVSKQVFDIFMKYTTKINVCPWILT